MSEPQRVGAPIEFWFDFASGYAYFAALEIEALIQQYGRTVARRPFTLGAAFKVTGAPVPPILPPRDGFLLLDRTKFAASVAADVKPELADFMVVSARRLPTSRAATLSMSRSLSCGGCHQGSRQGREQRDIATLQRPRPPIALSVGAPRVGSTLSLVADARCDQFQRHEIGAAAKRSPNGTTWLPA
jgi:hypothetical protein